MSFERPSPDLDSVQSVLGLENLHARALQNATNDQSRVDVVLGHEDTRGAEVEGSHGHGRLSGSRLEGDLELERRSG